MFIFLSILKNKKDGLLNIESIKIHKQGGFGVFVFFGCCLSLLLFLGGGSETGHFPILKDTCSCLKKSH